MESKSSKTIITIVAVLVGLALIISGVVWYRSSNSSGENNTAATVLSNQTDSNGVACTMDAKICPDGSSVGRVGPNCEFAACPAPINGSPAGTPDYVKG